MVFLGTFFVELFSVSVYNCHRCKAPPNRENTISDWYTFITTPESMANFGKWKKLLSLTTKNNSLFVGRITSNDSLLRTTSRKHVDICYLEGE